MPLGKKLIRLLLCNLFHFVAFQKQTLKIIILFAEESFSKYVQSFYYIVSNTFCFLKYVFDKYLYLYIQQKILRRN